MGSSSFGLETHHKSQFSSLRIAFWPEFRARVWSQKVSYAYLNSSGSLWCCRCDLTETGRFLPTGCHTSGGKCRESIPLRGSKGSFLSSGSGGCASAHDTACQSCHQDVQQSESIFRRPFLEPKWAPFCLPLRSKDLWQGRGWEPFATYADTARQSGPGDPQQFFSSFFGCSARPRLSKLGLLTVSSGPSLIRPSTWWGPPCTDEGYHVTSWVLPEVELYYIIYLQSYSS